MPALAIPAFWAAVGGIGAATGAVIAGSEQAGATTNAADLQAQAAAKTLAFNQQQAEALYNQQETANKANYGQYVANTNRLNSVGNILGLPGTVAPPFVPTPDPGFTTSTAPTPTVTPGPHAGTTMPPAATPAATTTAAPASGNPTDPSYITAQLTALYKSLGKTPTGPGTGPTDIAYMAQQIAATGGWTGGNIGYWTNKISGLVNGTAGAGTSGSAPSMGGTPASVAQYLAMSPTPYTSPATPQPYVTPQSVDAYLTNPYQVGA